MSAVVRKSVTDLTRRKARTFFTVLTLALAVASVGIFAVPPAHAAVHEARGRRPPARRRDRLDEAAAAQRRRAGRGWRALPNVTAVEPRSLFATRVWVGERRERAIVVGVPDYARQRADVVAIDSGAAPAAGAVLTDQNNAKRQAASTSAPAPTRACSPPTAASARCRSAASGRKLTGGQDDPSNDWITFYATSQTVGRAERRARLHVARLPPARQPPAGGRARPSPRSATSCARRTSFTAFDDLPVDPGARQLPRQGRLREARRRPERRHAAGAAVRAGARVQHDDDADRRADRRDRRDEGDRRPPARHPAHLPAHRAAARRRSGRCSAPRSGCCSPTRS